MGPTISFVKSQENFVFGGYTSVPWTSGDKTWRKDNDAFVFSVTNSAKHPVRPEKAREAVGHYKDYLLIFGTFGNFRIMDKCNE